MEGRALPVGGFLERGGLLARCHGAEDAARPSSGAADSEQRGGAGAASRAEGAAGRLSVQPLHPE